MAGGNSGNGDRPQVASTAAFDALLGAMVRGEEKPAKAPKPDKGNKRK